MLVILSHFLFCHCITGGREGFQILKTEGEGTETSLMSFSQKEESERLISSIPLLLQIKIVIYFFIMLINKSSGDIALKISIFP